MSINNVILLLPLLISISSALECRKCYDFPDAASLEEGQKVSFGTVITLAGNPPACDGSSQMEECSELNDECHELSVSSKLKGIAMQEGKLFQCGIESSRDTLCQTYTGMAVGAGITLDTCEVEKCDECSAAHTSTVSVILALVVAACMVM